MNSYLINIGLKIIYDFLAKLIIILYNLRYQSFTTIAFLFVEMNRTDNLQQNLGTRYTNSRMGTDRSGYGGQMPGVSISYKRVGRKCLINHTYKAIPEYVGKCFLNKVSVLFYLFARIFIYHS